MKEVQVERVPPQVSAFLAPVDTDIVYATLVRAGVSLFYPGFDQWFFGQVVPGLLKGERRISTFLLAGVPAGIAICKRTEVEKKLCTLWVSSHARRRGIAAGLADDAFAWLGTAAPVFTVPEEQLADFGGLLRSWSFREPLACGELYRPQRAEYVFNSHLFAGCLGGNDGVH